MKIGSVLVTGGNRGVGLEFVRYFSQLEDPPCFIFATYRSTKSLEDLKKIQDDSSVKSRVILIKMDVTVKKQIDKAKKIVEVSVMDEGLNLLINNAGHAQPQDFPFLTQDNLEMHFQTNTVGPIMILQAALNMAMRVIAVKVKDKGVLVVNMCPGWVKTDMGGKDLDQNQGQIEPEESVANLMKTLATLNESHRGSYMDRLGNQYPF